MSIPKSKRQNSISFVHGKIKKEVQKSSKEEEQNKRKKIKYKQCNLKELQNMFEKEKIQKN